jgi:hypothetical protein
LSYERLAERHLSLNVLWGRAHPSTSACSLLSGARFCLVDLGLWLLMFDLTEPSCRPSVLIHNRTGRWSSHSDHRHRIGRPLRPSLATLVVMAACFHAVSTSTHLTPASAAVAALVDEQPGAIVGGALANSPHSIAGEQLCCAGEDGKKDLLRATMRPRSHHLGITADGMGELNSRLKKAASMR